MCNYCMNEECAHNIEGDANPCGCGVLVGVRTCPECGCTCEPWWYGFSRAIDPLGQTNSIEDFLLENDEGNSNPLTKQQILQSLSESYGVQMDDEVGKWLGQNLPDRQTFKDSGAIASALISHLPQIQWNRATNDLLWAYPMEKVFLGQELQVGAGQVAVIMGRNQNKEKSYDSFREGKQVISKDSCSTVLAASRKLAPGTQQGTMQVLDGFPVFVSSSMEFEIDLMVSGQTKTLRQVGATGLVRLKISNPKLFLEQVGSKNRYKTDAVLSDLKKRFTQLIQKEMSLHEFDELANNSQLLEKVLADEAKSLGLDVVKVSLNAGDMRSMMFARGTVPDMSKMMMDPQKIAQLRQMAESMRAAQMSGMRQTFPQQQQPPPSGTTTQQPTPQTVTCASCNTVNPLGSKFCNNCGKPLSPAKKTCPKCGQQSDPNIKFCGNCGNKLP
jgi:hypothetical protein